MIKIKDFIINENEIVFINEYDAESLGIMLKGKDKCILVDAHLEDIEYNYDSQEKQYNEKTEQLISSLQTKNYKLQDKIEKLKKDLDIEINNSNIKSAQNKDKNIRIDHLEEKLEKIEKMFNGETLNKYYHGMSYEFEIGEFKEDILKIIKGSE